MGADSHEIGDGMAAIADELLEVVGDEGTGLSVVEADATGEATLSEEAELRDGELVDLEAGGCEHATGQKRRVKSDTVVQV